jgi:hypothetical protein
MAERRRAGRGEANTGSRRRKGTFTVRRKTMRKTMRAKHSYRGQDPINTSIADLVAHWIGA